MQHVAITSARNDAKLFCLPLSLINGNWDGNWHQVNVSSRLSFPVLGKVPFRAEWLASNETT